MSPDNELLEILSAESQAECDKIISDAVEQGRAKVKRAHTRASELKEERLGEIRKKVDAEMAKAASSARLEANKIMLRAKHSLIADAFKLAGERLAQIRESKRYEKILESLILETVPGAELSSARLLVDPRDEELAKRILAKTGIELEVSPTLSCLGGIRYEGEAKAVSVDNTFESRLKRAREDLMVRAASVLFAASQDG